MSLFYLVFNLLWAIPSSPKVDLLLLPLLLRRVPWLVAVDPSCHLQLQISEVSGKSSFLSAYRRPWGSLAMKKSGYQGEETRPLFSSFLRINFSNYMTYEKRRDEWRLLRLKIGLSEHVLVGKFLDTHGFVKNKLRCYPQQLESFCIFAIKSAYAIKIERLCHKMKCLCHKQHRNPLEFHKASAPEPSGTSQDISAPEPSGTSPSIFSVKTLRNLTRSLHRNLPEPQKVSAPELPVPAPKHSRTQPSTVSPP